MPKGPEKPCCTNRSLSYLLAPIDIPCYFDPNLSLSNEKIVKKNPSFLWNNHNSIFEWPANRLSTSLPSNTNAPIWSMSIEMHGKFLLGRLNDHDPSKPNCARCVGDLHIIFHVKEPWSLSIKKSSLIFFYHLYQNICTCL